MNKMRVFLLFAVLVGVISACQSKSEQTAGQEQDTMDDSLAVAPTEDEKTIFGVVEDASMNNFMLVTSKEIQCSSVRWIRSRVKSVASNWETPYR